MASSRSLPSCPAFDVIFCRCGNNALMHTEYSTFYPQSGLYRIEYMLFNVRHLSSSLGKHFWEMMIFNVDWMCERTISRSVSKHQYYLTFNTRDSTSMTVPLPCHINGVSYTGHVRRIQRWVRRFIRRRRVLAVMMGSHTRLGMESCLADVPADVLSEIAML